MKRDRDHTEDWHNWSCRDIRSQITKKK